MNKTEKEIDSIKKWEIKVSVPLSVKGIKNKIKNILKFNKKK